MNATKGATLEASAKDAAESAAAGSLSTRGGAINSAGTIINVLNVNIYWGSALRSSFIVPSRTRFRDGPVEQQRRNYNK